ncbi:anthranilate synthase component II [Polaribacter dokdonensis]|uniref:Anthranilate synthase component 2 n=2 Tax=Polaribacter dokdonensis DSW-5 TaxID=1300348 RepID=A0A1H5H1C9_9FLAO|nr:aminodeoxychorismate/anthranilate synthase component II [Polaribacter dokdonensis]SEE21762.1 anthranilate synthase component 2 [Polaribacter dokdonensis DSW-5]
MKILIIDNYDSFTYNLVHMVEEITGTFPAVFRNDEISINQVGEFDLIMLSPGPGIPDEAGILKEVIKTYAGVKPIFGVCLGLQAITEVFGGKIINLNDVYHGVATEMKVTDDSAVIFKDIPAIFLAARYHSWAATDEGFPNELKVTARDEEGLIQAIEHVAYPISAVQFHPESILTDVGKQLVTNFINSAELNAELDSASK